MSVEAEGMQRPNRRRPSLRLAAQPTEVARPEPAAEVASARRIEDELRSVLSQRPWVSSIAATGSPEGLRAHGVRSDHSQVRRRVEVDGATVWIDIAWDGEGELRDELVRLAIELAETRSHRRTAELQRDAIAARFASMQERMRERSWLASLGTMATSVAHDIRSPLWALMANTDYLATELAKWVPADEKNVWDVCQENRLAIEVIEGVLSSISNFVRERPVPDLVAIGPAIDAAVHVTRWHYDKAGVGVDTHTEGDVRGRASLSELTQALVSVLSNAAEASPRGSVVRVVARSEPQAAVIFVMDEGPGVPADLADRIFEPFHTTKATGMGLGLSVARELVEGFRGELRLRLDPPAEITPGRGACFELRVPNR